MLLNVGNKTTGDRAHLYEHIRLFSSTKRTRLATTSGFVKVQKSHNIFNIQQNLQYHITSEYIYGPKILQLQAHSKGLQF